MSYNNFDFNRAYNELLKKGSVLVPVMCVCAFSIFVQDYYGDIVNGGAFDDECTAQYVYID